MAEEDILMSASIMVTFIDTHQVDLTSKYHSYEFVSVNYTFEGKTFLEPKLLRAELMIGRYFMKR